MKNKIDLILKYWAEWYSHADTTHGVRSIDFNRVSGSLKNGTAYERKTAYFENITNIINNLTQKEKQFISVHLLTNSNIDYKIKYLKTNAAAYYRTINAIKEKISKKIGVI